MYGARGWGEQGGEGIESEGVGARIGVVTGLSELRR